MTMPLIQPFAQPNALRRAQSKFHRAVSEAEARFLCEKTRAFARGLDVLFHGTRYRESILASGFLKISQCSQCVAFTRSPVVAAHFATLPRDNDDGVGAILVFDRASLKTRYRLECIDDGWVADPSEFNELWRAAHDEFEECIFGRNVVIAPHLIGVISAPTRGLSHAQHALKRAGEMWHWLFEVAGRKLQ
jgi:hypothetical protein